MLPAEADGSQRQQDSGPGVDTSLTSTKSEAKSKHARRSTKNSRSALLSTDTDARRKLSTSDNPTSPQTSKKSTELVSTTVRRLRTLRLPPLYPYQKALVSDRARDVCTVSATQVGKSTGEACWLVSYAWEHPTVIHPYWWLAPTYNQIRTGLRYVIALTSSAGIMAGTPTLSPFPIVRLINGSVIEFRSWEREQNLFGDPIAGGVVDEAGLLTPSAQAAISTRRSATLGPLHYIGNPGLVAGPFRRLCALGEQAKAAGSQNAGVYSIHRWTWKDKHAALLTTNPSRADEYAQFVEQERRSLPDFEFRRLYEAEWTEDEAAVFRGLEAVLLRGETAPLPASADQFSLGVDVAQLSDFLACVSFGRETRRFDLRYHRRGVPYATAARELKAISDDLGKAQLVVEENGPGIALIQELDRVGAPVLKFTTSGQSKQELILTLAADVQESRAKIADQAPMPYEFAIYRYERTPSGLYRYTAPPGEHDDTVMAAALARWGAGRSVKLEDYGWV